jgi:hypothetical protein
MTTGPTIFLAEITAWTPAGATTVLRYSNTGYTTGASDTPASTYYDARISQAVDVSRSMFTPGSTQGSSIVGVGDLTLLNGDTLLDPLKEYSFDGRAITIRRSTTLNPVYPTDFATIFAGTMQSAEFTPGIIRIKLRDLLAGLNLPFQPTKYAGTNALPAGLEGVATDLQGKPKPVTYGVVFNISPPCVNTSKLIYQVNDGAVSSVDAVYDKGVVLGSGKFPLVARTTSFAGTNGVQGAAYGNGVFVATGDSGHIETSPDGITWTARSGALGGAVLDTLVFANGQFIAASSTNGGGVETSPDGITWTGHGVSGTWQVFAITYAAGLYVALIYDNSGTPTSAVVTSPDLVTWTTRSTGFSSSITAWAITYAAGLFVVVGGGTNITRIETSPDGITWTSRTNPLDTTTSAPNCIVFGRGRFVAGGSGTATVLVSPDGITWTSRTTPIVLRAITYGNDLFVGVSSIFMVTSPDGDTWTAQTTGLVTFDTQNAITSGAGRFVVGGYNSGTHAPFLLSTPAAGTFATLADLSDDTLAPTPGTYKVYASGGYIRLGSTPVGLITADVTQGANAAARTAGQLFAAVLQRVGKIAGDWSATDVTALDVANSAVLGRYFDSETTYLSVIDEITTSVGAGWWVDNSGVFRVAQFTVASGAPVASFTANDLLKPLNVLSTNDPGQGLPVFRCTVKYGEVYTVQTTDLAGGVTDARRAVVAQQWRTAVSTDATIQTSSLLSPETIEESALTTLTDAQAEAARRLALRKVARSRYEIVVPMNTETAVVDIGSVIQLTHPRFGLSVVQDAGGSIATLTGGALFRVLDITPSSRDSSLGPNLRLTIWGRSTSANRIDTLGNYRTTTTGAYRVTTRSA